MKQTTDDNIVFNLASKASMMFLEETPLKFGNSMPPETPQLAIQPVPDSETPFTKFLTNLSLHSVIKDGDILTPTTAKTPGIFNVSTSPPSTEQKSGCSVYSRATDYSSCSSYYKPDDNAKEIEKIINAEQKKQSSQKLRGSQIKLSQESGLTPIKDDIFYANELLNRSRERKPYCESFEDRASQVAELEEKKARVLMKLKQKSQVSTSKTKLIQNLPSRKLTRGLPQRTAKRATTTTKKLSPIKQSGKMVAARNKVSLGMVSKKLSAKYVSPRKVGTPRKPGTRRLSKEIEAKETRELQSQKLTRPELNSNSAKKDDKQSLKTKQETTPDSKPENTKPDKNSSKDLIKPPPKVNQTQKPADKLTESGQKEDRIESIETFVKDTNKFPVAKVTAHPSIGAIIPPVNLSVITSSSDSDSDSDDDDDDSIQLTFNPSNDNSIVHSIVYTGNNQPDVTHLRTEKLKSTVIRLDDRNIVLSTMETCINLWENRPLVNRQRCSSGTSTREVPKIKDDDINESSEFFPNNLSILSSPEASSSSPVIKKPIITIKEKMPVTKESRMPLKIDMKQNQQRRQEVTAVDRNKQQQERPASSDKKGPLIDAVLNYIHST